jgi:hypothetical protein
MVAAAAAVSAAVVTPAAATIAAVIAAIAAVIAPAATALTAVTPSATVPLSALGRGGRHRQIERTQVQVDRLKREHEAEGDDAGRCGTG